MEIDVKKFHLPGVEIKDTCSKCGTECVYDFAYDYLRYPIANEPITFKFNCRYEVKDDTGVWKGCYNSWDRKILLTVKLELLPKDENVAKSNASG